MRAQRNRRRVSIEVLPAETPGEEKKTLKSLEDDAEKSGLDPLSDLKQKSNLVD